MDTLETEIAAVLERLTAAWNALDFAALAALWDQQDERPFYLAEEAPQALMDWTSVQAYWDHTHQVTRALSMRIWDLAVKAIADDLAVAMWQMHWNAAVDGYDRPLGGENRVSAILRRRGDAWRFIHYVEAPLAPILYVKRQYERAVDADFPGRKSI